MRARVFAAIDRGIGLVEEAVSVSALVALSVLVIIQVFWRYVLSSGILWTDEVITILMVTMVMFGSAAVTRRLLHTELLVFVNMMPPPLRRVVRALTSLIGLAFLLIFLYASAKYSLTTRGMVTTVLRIPMQYVYVLLPIGAVLSIYEYLKTMPASFVRQRDETAGPSAKAAAKSEREGSP
jgi:TRAP-type C4-dicarboxylate transport system permease small subunit